MTIELFLLGDTVITILANMRSNQKVPELYVMVAYCSWQHLNITSKIICLLIIDKSTLCGDIVVFVKALLCELHKTTHSLKAWWNRRWNITVLLNSVIIMEEQMFSETQENLPFRIECQCFVGYFLSFNQLVL